MIERTSHSPTIAERLTDSRAMRASVAVVAASAALLAGGCGSANKPISSARPVVRAYTSNEGRVNRVANATKRAFQLIIRAEQDHQDTRLGFWTATCGPPKGLSTGEAHLVSQGYKPKVDDVCDIGTSRKNNAFVNAGGTVTQAGSLDNLSGIEVSIYDPAIKQCHDLGTDSENSSSGQGWLSTITHGDLDIDVRSYWSKDTYDATSVAGAKYIDNVVIGCLDQVQDIIG